jgi:hypothetical protein
MSTRFLGWCGWGLLAFAWLPDKIDELSDLYGVCIHFGIGLLIQTAALKTQRGEW